MTHVVMLVANDVSTDSRVKKEALAVARTGLSVTVVGLTAGNQREESLLGPVRVIRVPVSYTLRDSRVRKRVRLRQARPPFFWYRFDADRAAAEIRLQCGNKPSATPPRRHSPSDVKLRATMSGSPEKASCWAGGS